MMQACASDLRGLANGCVVAQAAGDRESAVDAAFGRLRELLPTPDRGSRHEVPVISWTRLARFLNVVDGLVGQGLRVLVLVTTNEDLRSLQPAVARPGRCAANVEFGRLPAADANDSLEAHGADDRVDRATSLASLYSPAEGFEVDAPRQPAGFVA